ncbi:MAG: hypothetical protein H7Z41_11300 [Cytophagales bacterium]|nr:hypothetical protein [Armatimonadota bacterium]
MPALTIQGQKINRVLDARVEITHGDAREAMQIPIQQFVVKLPLDHDTSIAEWALAPHGPRRWKTVELQTQDRSRKTNHTWTLHKSYVHNYTEKEFPAQSGSDTDQGNYIEIIVRGTLVHNNVDYDGKNILQIAAGEAEPAAE